MPQNWQGPHPPPSAGAVGGVSDLNVASSPPHAHRSPGSLPRMKHQHQVRVSLDTLDCLGTTVIEILTWQPQGDAAAASGVCHGSPPRGVRRSSRGIRDPQSIMATTLRAKLDIMDVGPQGSFDWTKAEPEPGSYTTGVDLASTLPLLVLEHLFSFLDLTS